jgi:hypothetical protein
MTFAKKLLLCITSTALALFVFLACLVIVLTHPWNLGDYPTASAIEAIKIGMSEHDVQQRLGIPCKIEPSDGDCEANDEKITYTYSRPTLRNYPHVWVHFNDGLVISVYAKEYPHMGDDNAVYSYSGEHATYNFIKPEFYEIF